MSESSKGVSFSLPSTGMFALALAVLGLIWSGPNPLIAERPGSNTTSEAHKSRIQNIDARLWQDPLGAIQKDATKPVPVQHTVDLNISGKKSTSLTVNDQASTGNLEHGAELSIHRAFSEARINNVMVLAIMIPGGPYPESEESRRRTRYAVLSALATMDYAPVSSEFIGYFRTKQSQAESLPRAVPFELFDKWENKMRSRVIALWLDDSHFDADIRSGVKELFNQAVPGKLPPVDGKRALLIPDRISRIVIGPNQSDQLRRFVNQWASSKDATDGEIKYLSAEATIERSRLPYVEDENSDRDLLKEHSVLRTITDDGAVSKALVHELKLRQIDPKIDHVLLISEWDTSYGRLLPLTFSTSYNEEKSDGKTLKPGRSLNRECVPLGGMDETTADRANSRVYCVNYMRGIDGYLPGEESHEKSDHNDQKAADTIQVNGNIDKPSGNNQKDYLRRLVDQVRKLDSKLQSQRLPCPVRNNGIAAIGVLGSDIYDKLMILQALRPYFPGKIFFTTDLDAAYFSPHELPYTHNLIVASAYGLSLAPELQLTIPPFRDSYQTAMFFTTKLATSDWETGTNGVRDSMERRDWLGNPRIFEIGRNGAIDLSMPNPAGNVGCSSSNFANCDHIHPDSDISDFAGTSSSLRVLQIITILAALALAYSLSWTMGSLPERFLNDLRSRSLEAKNLVNYSPHRQWRIAALSSVLLLFAVLACMYFYRKLVSDGNIEPFYWVNGVSIWPSNFLIALAIVISIAFYRHICRQLSELESLLEREFELPSVASLSGTLDPLSIRTWQHRTSGEEPINVRELWSDYKMLGACGARVRRAASKTAIFVLFGITAIMLTGGLAVPSRGITFYLDVALEMASVIAVVFLIMWVVDAERLFSRFIELLAEDRKSDWPDIADDKWGWPEEIEDHVANWIDIRFVAQYTKCTEYFIWYPLLPMILMGAARSPVFDNWTFSSGLIVCIAIVVLHLFSTAFFLQHGAKVMRAKAVKRPEEHLRLLRGGGVKDAHLAGELSRLIAEIRDTEEGAFTPFLNQPMVQALLAFLSGTGGVALLLDRAF